MKRSALSSVRSLAVACALLTNGCTLPEINFAQPRDPEFPPAGLDVTTNTAAAADAAQMLVTGLGRGNELQPVELRIRVVGAPALDAGASIGFIFDDRSRTGIGLSNYWRHDPRDNSLVISAEQMAKLLDRLPRHPVNVMLGLANGTGEFAFDASFKAIKRAPQSTPA